uniref:Uncharacterized protein n=1 Tax=Rhizophora mucronata TaxID=61149 RepID=A0A2P2PKI7_RHIMU
MNQRKRTRSHNDPTFFSDRSWARQVEITLFEEKNLM